MFSKFPKKAKFPPRSSKPVLIPVILAGGLNIYFHLRAEKCIKTLAKCYSRSLEISFTPTVTLQVTKKVTEMGAGLIVSVTQSYLQKVPTVLWYTRYTVVQK